MTFPSRSIAHHCDRESAPAADKSDDRQVGPGGLVLEDCSELFRILARQDFIGQEQRSSASIPFTQQVVQSVAQITGQAGVREDRSTEYRVRPCRASTNTRSWSAACTSRRYLVGADDLQGATETPWKFLRGSPTSMLLVEPQFADRALVLAGPLLDDRNGLADLAGGLRNSATSKTVSAR